jgi:hypothetical protein
MAMKVKNVIIYILLSLTRSMYFCTLLLYSIRSPGPVAPQDVHCEGFDMTYTRIASDTTQYLSSSMGPGGTMGISASVMMSESMHRQTSSNNFLDKKVDDSIQKFLESLVQIGPELLSGSLTLSFFERRASKQLFGLMSHEEKIVWEQWRVHVVVNNTPRPVNDDKASIMERQRIQHTAEAMLQSVFLKIYQYASGVDDVLQHGYDSNKNNTARQRGLDHIPPSMYEFEIRCSRRAEDRENVYSRVANMPALLNLDGS